jgi:hypothetical protein
VPLCVLLGGSVGAVPAYNSNGLWLRAAEEVASEAVEVADRILRCAAIAGRENVVAGTDCGRAKSNSMLGCDLTLALRDHSVATIELQCLYRSLICALAAAGLCGLARLGEAT